jgi:hypothetical protein
MLFDPARYGDAVARILALDGGGERLMPLAFGTCSCERARSLLSESSARALFPDARAPEAALSGLYLYFSCLDESHSLSQQIDTADGSFWHGIMHRQEPDPGNSGYWFRRAGRHAIFPLLAAEAAGLAGEFPRAGFSPGAFQEHAQDGDSARDGEWLVPSVSGSPRRALCAAWDPFAFIGFCEQARRRPGSDSEQLALRIQRAEWQLLFDYCASNA